MENSASEQCQAPEQKETLRCLDSLKCSVTETEIEALEEAQLADGYTEEEIEDILTHVKNVESLGFGYVIEREFKERCASPDPQERAMAASNWFFIKKHESLFLPLFSDESPIVRAALARNLFTWLYYPERIEKLAESQDIEVRLALAESPFVHHSEFEAVLKILENDNRQSVHDALSKHS